MRASLYMNLQVCVLCNDTANSSGCLMANMWLMGDELMGGGNIMAVLFRLYTSQKNAGPIPDGFIGIFHRLNPSTALWPWSRLNLE